MAEHDPMRRNLLRGAATKGSGYTCPTVPLKAGWLQPDNMAGVSASDAADMVTGAEYEVTGGDRTKDV